MSSPRITRLRAAIILALALFVWSDAALASFVCPHMSGCEHGMPVAGDSNAGTDNAETEAMPCCPVNPGASMDCDVSAMECCAWHHSNSDVSAILFASDQPRPKQVAAAASATVSAQQSLIERAYVPGLADDHPYVKPVTQQKTDLRI